jgi:plastocyanin
MKKLLLPLLFALAPSLALADMPEFKLAIKGHQFTPATLEIPADTKVKIVVKNEDATAEEFESHALKREKIVPAGSEASVIIGPLKAGEYPFVGEYHEDTAKGKIVVK